MVDSAQSGRFSAKARGSSQTGIQNRATDVANCRSSYQDSHQQGPSKGISNTSMVLTDHRITHKKETWPHKGHGPNPEITPFTHQELKTASPLVNSSSQRTKPRSHQRSDLSKGSESGGSIRQARHALRLYVLSSLSVSLRLSSEKSSLSCEPTSRKIPWLYFPTQGR